MAVTVTTSRSWFQRIGGSIGGMLFGFLMLIAMVILLFWNEGRAVQTAKSLDEGAGAVISVSADAPDPANEGRLVHVSGRADVKEMLTDPALGISARGIALSRNVEMYQWQESSKSETRKKLGGGEETVTTYSYSKGWSTQPVDSSRFQQSEGHDNPPMALASDSFMADTGTLGGWELHRNILSKIGGSEKVPLPKELEDTVRQALGTARPVRISDGAVYAGRDPLSPQVGDLRISYSLVGAKDISVIARQAGDSFAPYQTQAGDALEMVDTGIVPAGQMFKSAQSANATLTWILRAVGLFLLFVAFGLIAGPVGVVFDVIPMLGSIARLGTGLIAFAAAILVGSITIGIAWFWYRPLMTVIIIAIGFGVTWLISRRSPKAAPSEAAAPAAAAEQPAQDTRFGRN